jgi:hypothetical protein
VLKNGSYVIIIWTWLWFTEWPQIQEHNSIWTLTPPQQKLSSVPESDVPPQVRATGVCWPGNFRWPLSFCTEVGTCGGWGRQLTFIPSPLDINYESMTFPSLITLTTGWSKLWFEAPGGKFYSQPAKPGPGASAFMQPGSCGFFCSRKILSLWWRPCLHPGQAPFELSSSLWPLWNHLILPFSLLTSLPAHS